MSAQTLVHLTTRSGLAGGLVETYRQELRTRSTDAVALLLPTAHAAALTRRLVLEADGADGLLDPRILTFPELAETVLVANHHNARELTAAQRELLVADVLAELASRPELNYLRATCDLPGTVRALCSVLDEIKRGGISSDDFPRLIARHSPGHPANAAVAAVYARYQDRLQAGGLYDEAGRFWDALEVLKAGKRKPVEALEVLLVAGFEEFTTTQLAMLEVLAEFAERVEISLWFDPARPAMTPRTEATRQELHRRLQAEETAGQPQGPWESPPTASMGESNLARLRGLVFAPQERELTVADGSVVVLEAAGGLVGECREIARRLKLLLARAPELTPNQIAIFLRSWDTGYDAALRQACEWYGVPVEVAQGPVLASVPAVRVVLDLLDVVEGQWLRPDVIKLLNSSYVAGLPGLAKRLSGQRLEKLALDAGIIGGVGEGRCGAAAWREGLAQHRKRLQDQQRRRELAAERLGVTADSEAAATVLEDDEGDRFPTATELHHALERLTQAEELVDALDRLLQPLAEASSLADAARALGALLQALELTETAQHGAPDRVAQDLQGLSLLADVLREIAEAPEVLGLTAPADSSQFAAQVRQACSTARLPVNRRRQQGVQVLDLAQAGLEEFAVVVVCGLREGLFPARRRQDVLYSDAERQALQAALPGLRPRLGGHHDDEHLLHGALVAAQRQVWLTYPLTEANGAPVLRSLYVEEVLRHWTAARRPQVLQTRRQSEVIVGLDEVGQYAELLEALQANRHHTPGEGSPEPDRVVLVDALRPSPAVPDLAAVQALAAIERDRGGSSPGVYGGVLRAPAIIGALAADYGPEHTFSVSQLNTYAGCPMRFFLSRVLGLEAPLEPTEDLDRRDLGTLAHRILAQFFGDRRIGGDNAEPLTTANLAAARQDLARCVKRATDAWAERVFGAQQVWQKAIERLEADLNALLEYEAARNEESKGRSSRWSPPRQVRDVEVNFGNEGEFVVQTRLPEPIKARGRIDRVDLTELDGGKLWVVWDYKTGDGISRKLVEAGADLQLPLYALAVRELYPGEAAGFHLWGYCRVTRPVGWTQVLTPTSKQSLEAILDTAQAKIADYVEALRAGRFPAEPNADANPCRWCDFRGVCRQ